MLFIIPLDPFLGEYSTYLLCASYDIKIQKKKREKKIIKKNEEKTYEKKGVLDVQTRNCQQQC